ncbi:hypothetical protein Rsub_04167 [Raphidocelis subcapitata]|uniref:Uncharacterized protein n=1 Tax=Raphidocelis subcapitata TaxID=307507 RepID=A0A2V0P2J8_9CHLO|nr:hypothetical protein Rsub_04167 [Raphidocelis subcapitata]|eukprot:GBF91427.1 hypothetical protein Rsub_04167 [Raphidocelis subcapitata]
MSDEMGVGDAAAAAPAAADAAPPDAALLDAAAEAADGDAAGPLGAFDKLAPDVLEIVMGHLVPKPHMLLHNFEVYAASAGVALSCSGMLRAVMAAWEQRGLLRTQPQPQPQPRRSLKRARGGVDTDCVPPSMRRPFKRSHVWGIECWWHKGWAWGELADGPAWEDGCASGGYGASRFCGSASDEEMADAPLCEPAGGDDAGPAAVRPLAQDIALVCYAGKRYRTASEKLIGSQVACEHWRLVPADLNMMHRHTVVPIRPRTQRYMKLGGGGPDGGVGGGDAPMAEAAGSDMRGKAEKGEGEEDGGEDPEVSYAIARPPGYRMRDIMPAVRVRFGGNAALFYDRDSASNCFASGDDLRRCSLLEGLKSMGIPSPESLMMLQAAQVYIATGRLLGIEAPKRALSTKGRPTVRAAVRSVYIANALLRAGVGAPDAAAMQRFRRFVFWGEGATILGGNQWSLSQLPAAVAVERRGCEVVAALCQAGLPAEALMGHAVFADSVRTGARPPARAAAAAAALRAHSAAAHALLRRLGADDADRTIARAEAVLGWLQGAAVDPSHNGPQQAGAPGDTVVSDADLAALLAIAHREVRWQEVKAARAAAGTDPSLPPRPEVARHFDDYVRLGQGECARGAGGVAKAARHEAQCASREAACARRRRDVAEMRAAASLEGDAPEWLARRYAAYLECPGRIGPVALRALVATVVQESEAGARGAKLDATRAEMGFCPWQQLPWPRDPSARGEPRASLERYVQTGEGEGGLEALLKAEAEARRAAADAARRAIGSGRKPECVYCDQHAAAGCVHQSCSRCCGGGCQRHGILAPRPREGAEPDACGRCTKQPGARGCARSLCARCCIMKGGCKRHKEKPTLQQMCIAFGL